MFILRVFKTINLVCKHFCNRNACKIKLEKAIVSYLLLSSKISRNMFLIPSPLLPWFFWRIKEVQKDIRKNTAVSVDQSLAIHLIQ